MKELTADELSELNGKDGQPAYIAYEGKIYDVSKIFQDGEHGGVKAGADISDTFGGYLCPHQKSIFEKFSQVGILR